MQITGLKDDVYLLNAELLTKVIDFIFELHQHIGIHSIVSNQVRDVHIIEALFFTLLHEQTAEEI